MSLVKRPLALALALAALAMGVPAAALPCGGAGPCAMMARSSATGADCPTRAGLTPAMSCCEPAPAQVPAASGAKLVPPVAKIESPASEAATAVRDAVAPSSAPAATIAERSRAEKRHAQGLFTLLSVYRI